MKRNIVILLVVLGIILIGGAFFVMTRKQNMLPTTSQSNTETNQTAQPTLIQVPFEYTVKSISSSQIILTGERGDIVFPTNFAITYYDGDRGSKNTVTQSALRVGQKVNLDMIPGQSASIFILNSK